MYPGRQDFAQIVVTDTNGVRGKELELTYTVTFWRYWTKAKQPESRVTTIRSGQDACAKCVVSGVCEEFRYAGSGLVFRA